MYGSIRFDSKIMEFEGTKTVRGIETFYLFAFSAFRTLFEGTKTVRGIETSSLYIFS